MDRKAHRALPGAGPHLAVNLDEAANLGGQGWAIGPDGEVLGLTSRERPFVTVALDLAVAERAKQTYPRYVAD